MKDNRGNTINYVNEDGLNEIKSENQKITFKSLYKKLNASVAAVIAFITTNQLTSFLGGMTEDELILLIGKEIGKLETLLKYEDFNALMTWFTGVKIAFLEGSADAISLLWNAAMTNPIVATILVTALIAGGAYLIGKIPLYFIDKAKKNGEIKMEQRNMAL